jgi:hypothetical protein
MDFPPLWRKIDHAHWFDGDAALETMGVALSGEGADWVVWLRWGIRQPPRSSG